MNLFQNVNRFLKKKKKQVFWTNHIFSVKDIFHCEHILWGFPFKMKSLCDYMFLKTISNSAFLLHKIIHSFNNQLFFTFRKLVLSWRRYKRYQIWCCIDISCKAFTAAVYNRLTYYQGTYKQMTTCDVTSALGLLKQRIMKTLSAHLCVSLLLVVDFRLYYLTWVSVK